MNNIDKEFDMFTVYLRSKFSQDCSRNETYSEMNTEMVEREKIKQLIHQKHREYIEKKILELEGMKRKKTWRNLEHNSALSDIIANYKKELTELQ